MQNKIISYKDLDVYQRSYKLSVIVCTKVIVKLPADEKFDLTDQTRRSARAMPRLIAEGFGKRHQKKGFQKYLDDAIAENNETIVSLCHIRDIYPNITHQSTS
ncbi:MAG: four helix bundle protein [Patescibacteria group bacterium]|nr:four helix bundle protein [Patescibacteria group bacterium]